MKINKLFAILFAVLGVQTLSAQVEWTSKTNLLTNPSFETDAAISDLTTCGWATDRATGWTITPASSSNAQVGVGNASSVVQGIGSTFSPSEGSNYFYTRNNWNADTEYTISQTISSDLPAGLYKLTCKTATYSSDAKLNTIELSLQEGDNDPVCQNGIVLNVWNTWGVILVKESDDTPLTIKARMKPGYSGSGKHYAMLLDDFQLEYISPENFASASVDNPIDFSALINNSTIYNHTTRGNMPRGWTAYSHTTGNGNYTESDKCDTRLEGWSGGNLNIDYYQTINNLPPGKYQVTALAQERSGNGLTNIYIYSDPNRAVGAVGQTEADYSTEPLAILSGTANIGIQSTATDWVTADNFRIKYVGEDLSMYETQYTSVKAAAESAIADEAYITVIGKEKTDLQAAIDAEVEDTKAAYLSAISTLETATAAFKAATSDYAALATEKEIAAGLGMTEEAIATATATTKTGLAALQDLKVAEYNYIQQTYTETATLGSWTEDFGGELDNEGYKASSPKYMDDWQGSNVTRTAKQTITLPAGNYALSVIARGQAGASGQLYYKIGETTTNVALIMKGNRGRGVDVNGVANFSDEATYNCDGEGFGWEYRFITFQLNEETAVEIGASATIQGQWASIYAPVLLTTEASIKNLRLIEINNLLSEVPTGKMNATVQSTLDSKKAAAEAASLENSIEELTTIATELNEAIAEANTSIAAYEIIPTYIAKANKIDESIAADYQTAYDNGTISESAETVFQDLEVATYNYVTGEFTYEVELEAGGWVSEGPVGSKSDQHYSGNSSSYMEQSSAAWGSDAWEISYKYEKTLPAGKYIFKVAGRRAQGTGNTMSLNVTNITDSENPVELGSVNDFPEGDVGLGINKAGAASFNAEDEAGFANNNAGRGWQWRYVMFELDAETTVEVAVNAAATTHQQWISFCDATLQMTDETYLEANKGALDAPTAAAKALLDTKPMGDDENAALNAALAMPVTTGAELQAKINALNTAVANANAWLTAYNEAKAPLVAALERFEADYNLEGDVDHAYMSNSVWDNVLAMVEAASAAKDATNSYEGFAAATTNLVDALDAADVSIAEYAALKEALDNANAAATVNWGDEPFQRPTEFKEDLTTAIDAAQTVYNAANGEGVTSQTTALNEALDVVNNLELNDPAEGAVYNIVVATAGHAHEGAPVVASLDASKANGSDANNLTGYGFAAKEDYTDGPANMLYTFTKVEGNNYHISVKVKGATVYLTYGSLNGSAAGWKESQIQGTTDIEKAGEFEIVASNTTEGIIKIRNTVTNEFIDSQDEGNIYTDTGIENEDFALTLVEELSAEISIDAADKYATCVLMFDADLANTVGLTVYVPESYTTQDGLNYFVFKVFEEAVLPAYTPCLLYAENGFEGTLTGEVKMDGYAYNVAEGGYLYGALESQGITEGYVMVKLNGEDEVTFRNVSSSGKDITIPAGKCWLQVPAAQASVASFTCLFRGGDASNIDEVLLDKISVKDGAIYTLDGKRVSNIERGKIYVINGQKVIVK